MSVPQVTSVRSKMSTVQIHSFTPPFRLFFIECLLYIRHHKFFLLQQGSYPSKKLKVKEMYRIIERGNMGDHGPYVPTLPFSYNSIVQFPSLRTKALGTNQFSHGIKIDPSSNTEI